MDRAEIERALEVGHAHSMVIDVREVAEAPGTLRKVTLYRACRVEVEFERCEDYVNDNGEGAGLKYIGTYPGFDSMVSDLEQYLGRKVDTWRDLSPHEFVPSTLVDPAPAATLAFFEAKVRNGEHDIPVRGRFELAGIHWRHVALFGKYRPDKLGDEVDVVIPARE